MNIDWGWVIKIGGPVALASFLWVLIKEMNSYFRKPELKINFREDIDLRDWTFTDLHVVRRFATLHIRNERKKTATRCVAILKILKKPQNVTNLEPEYALHWAGVGYSQQTTGAEPVDIGPEPRRLDVAFTQQGQNISGCWVAIPFALSGPLIMNQAYLPPGEYEVEIKAHCENGKGDKAKFKITSPQQWDRLDMDKL